MIVGGVECLGCIASQAVTWQNRICSRFMSAGSRADSQVMGRDMTPGVVLSSNPKCRK